MSVGEQKHGSTKVGQALGPAQRGYSVRGSNKEEAMSKNKFGKPHNAFVGSLEHHGGKKLSQQGAEFFHKIHEARKRPTPGFRGKK